MKHKLAAIAAMAIAAMVAADVVVAAQRLPSRTTGKAERIERTAREPGKRWEAPKPDRRGPGGYDRPSPKDSGAGNKPQRGSN